MQSLFCQHYNQALSVWLFISGQLLIAWPVVAIVLGKAAVFHHGLNGCRADSKKQNLLDFSFSLFKQSNKKRQKIVAAEVNETEVVSVEDDGKETEDVLLGASVSVLPVWKSSKLHGEPSVLFHSSDDLLLYMEVQFMFTLGLICMQCLCVSIIHQTMTQIIGSLTCLHDLLMHACILVYAFISAVTLNGCLFHGGSRGLEPLFFIWGDMGGGGGAGQLQEAVCSRHGLGVGGWRGQIACSQHSTESVLQVVEPLLPLLGWSVVSVVKVVFH